MMTDFARADLTQALPRAALRTRRYPSSPPGILERVAGETIKAGRDANRHGAPLLGRFDRTGNHSVV